MPKAIAKPARKQVQYASISIGEIPLPKTQAAITIVAKSGKGKIGELQVSRGSIRWKAVGKHNEMTWTWTQFRAAMARIADA